MSTCNVCGLQKSTFIMHNKSMCMKCDDLMFDIEIECEEENGKRAEKTPKIEFPKRSLPSSSKK